MLIKSLTKVDKLTKRVENLFDERQYYEDDQKRREARLKEVQQADEIIKTDFWCKKHGDTTGMGYKVSFKDRELGWCAYYESFGAGWPKEISTCCKGLRRHITDKHFDPYYLESEMITLQMRQSKENGDLLQPGQYGFNTKYGDPDKKKWQKMEQEERTNWQLKNG